ncbi:MAG TPA: hypothetical protein VKK31_08830 [Thermoanaerobaculia bacterium]|nr:hypothetical protein [Thermoanaerobaculia bacterium]
MAREPQYGVTLNGWERLLISLEANATDFPQLEVYRALLASMLAQAKEASAQQAVMAASKQGATKRLKEMLGDGRKIATVLRTSVRQLYGNRSEKLVEFDLQPLRARIRKAVQPKEPPTTT